jgi:hypothetical protein
MCSCAAQRLERGGCVHQSCKDKFELCTRELNGTENFVFRYVLWALQGRDPALRIHFLTAKFIFFWLFFVPMTRGSFTQK